tara:strand:- start:1075 stop:1524 length:450 start_codon:yes stop_codon:yes gene_type:complete
MSLQLGPLAEAVDALMLLRVLFQRAKVAQLVVVQALLSIMEETLSVLLQPLELQSREVAALLDGLAAVRMDLAVVLVLVVAVTVTQAMVAKVVLVMVVLVLSMAAGMVPALGVLVGQAALVLIYRDTLLETMVAAAVRLHLVLLVLHGQ